MSLRPPSVSSRAARASVGPAVLIGWVALSGCAEDPPPPEEEPPPVDAPALVHVAPEGPVPAGIPVTLSVSAADPDGVREVALYQRTVGAVEFQKVPLVPLVDGDTGLPSGQAPVEALWTGEIVARAPAVEYRFRAFDDSDYLVAAELPADGGTYRLEVEEGAWPAPYTEGFDTAASELDLYALGWTEHARADSGVEWALSQLRSTSAPWAIRHRAGVVADVTSDDWLVAPTLDLSGLSTAEVTWQEHGRDTALAAHSLWVSVGAPDPAAGDFVLAAELPPPPEDAWGRRLVDLSAWAGESRVTVAWRYEGTVADEWTLDDIAVDVLGPDLQLAGFAQGELAPGATGELTLVVDSLGAPVSTFRLVAETAHGVFFDGSVAPGTVAVPFPVDAAVADDSLLDVTLTATAGGEVFAWTETVRIGDPAVATVGFELDDTGFVEVVVGSDGGEHVAFAGVLGPAHHVVEVDLLGAADLPPSPHDRWYARVDAAVPGALTDFLIAWDGATYAGDDLGPFDGEATFWLPARAEPVISWSALDPPLAPLGSARWELELSNLGGPTVGPTTLDLGSPDGRLSFDVASYDLGSDWAGAVAIEPAVTVGEVTDGRPVPVTLTVADAVDSYVVESELPVPWPVLHLTGAAVDGDGIVDPGEAAALTLAVANGGTLATGTLDCTLQGLTVSSGPVPLFLDVGASGDLAFDVVAPVDALAGEVLPLTLDCGPHLAVGELPVGEPPWTWLTALPDDYRDALSPDALEVHHARWRVVGDTLELEVVADRPFDPATALVEAWFESPYAGWELYQLTAVGGVGTLRGYSLAAWWVLDPPVVTIVDDTTLRLEVDLDDLALSEDSLSLGLGSGFCGGVDYFCDHYPDGWGDPYQVGLITSAWADVTW